jgi:hypothetical protein
MFCARKNHDTYAFFTGKLFFGLAATLLFTITGCANKTSLSSYHQETKKNIALLGYTIQIGAFSNIYNAARLTTSLEQQGIDAYYFVHSSGLYKVRFGNFPTRPAAQKVAVDLQQSKIIDEFYIVSPETYPVAKQKQYGQHYLRKSILKTAKSFLGIPYKWGGTNPTDGFDCSGLTMAVYQLNGLDLPRTSKGQFSIGENIRPRHLQKGDLVFFATSGGKRVSHVGIYTGNNSFIHAPSKGEKIRITSLNNKYFKKRYIGARTYF